MDSELLNGVCAAFFMLSTVVFFYYLYLTIKSYMKCKSETREELPCPNTCNPGYECKQTESVADFVIGEVVQEGVAEDEKQEGAEAELEESVAEAEEAPQAAEDEAAPQAARPPAASI
jgi:hypothetical protein